MDEPFGAVDPLVRRELQREMVRIQAELNKTIIFVTHDVDEALALGDEIILLREGARVAQRGSEQSCSPSLPTTSWPVSSGSTTPHASYGSKMSPTPGSFWTAPAAPSGACPTIW